MYVVYRTLLCKNVFIFIQNNIKKNKYCPAYHAENVLVALFNIMNYSSFLLLLLLCFDININKHFNNIQNS